MSRIGRLPVVLPQGVDVTVSGRTVEVKGPKGTLSRQVHPDMRVAIADRQVTVSRPTDQRQHLPLARGEDVGVAGPASSLHLEDEDTAPSGELH